MLRTRLEKTLVCGTAVFLLALLATQLDYELPYMFVHFPESVPADWAERPVHQWPFRLLFSTLFGLVGASFGYFVVGASRTTDSDKP